VSNLRTIRLYIGLLFLIVLVPAHRAVPDKGPSNGVCVPVQIVLKQSLKSSWTLLGDRTQPKLWWTQNTAQP